MYLKNVAGQNYGFGLISATTGGAVLGATVTGFRVLDGGVQAPIAGSFTEKGNSQYNLAFAQSDTNAETGSYILLATGAIPVAFTIAYFSNFDGVAQGGGTSSITLQAGYSPGVNSYVYWRIALVDVVGNVGRGQSRTVTAYDPNTGIATVDRQWDVQPIAGSLYTWSTPADLPSPVRVQVADSVLSRGIAFTDTPAGVEFSMPQYCLGTIILAALEWDISGASWRIKQTDGTTRYTKTITASAGASPITSVT